MDTTRTYILNPFYTLRHDLKRSFIISNDSSFPQLNGKVNFSKECCTKIHPVQAMILSFFSHNKPLWEIINELSYFLDKDEESIKKIILPFINNKEPLVTIFQENRYLFPIEVLIESDNSNLLSFRSYDVEDFLYTELDFKTKRMINAPLNVTLMLNNTCLTNCIYCYADIRKRQNCSIPFDTIVDLLKQSYDLKVADFGVLGGEFFLYPRWFDLLKEMSKYNFYPDLISTKVPLSVNEIEKLKDVLTDNTTLQISFDSIKENELRTILKVKGDYADKMNQMFDNLAENDIKVNIATTLTTYNSTINGIEELGVFLNQYPNIQHWDIGPAFNSLYIDNKYFKDIKVDYITVSKIYSYIESIKSKFHYNVELDRSFLDKEYYKITTGSKDFKGASCSANRNHMLILPDGKVTICEQLYWNPNFIVGDINFNTIREVWNSERSLFFANLKRTDIRPSSKCHSCEIFEDCHSNLNKCWADILKAYGSDNWDYPDPRCAKAPKMLTNLSFND